MLRNDSGVPVMLKWNKTWTDTFIVEETIYKYTTLTVQMVTTKLFQVYNSTPNQISSVYSG